MSMAFNKGKRFGLTMGINKRDMKNLRREMLTELNLGLEDKLNAKVGLLSGGTKTGYVFNYGSNV